MEDDFPTEGASCGIICPDDWEFLELLLLNPYMLVAYAVAGVIFFWGWWRRR